MKCNEFMSLLPLYPDALSSPQAAADLRLHTTECPECAARLQEQEILLSTLNTLNDDIDLPDAFCDGWRSAVRSEDTVPRKSRIDGLKTGAFAAAAVLMVVCGTALMRGGMLFQTEGMDRQTLYKSSEMIAATGAPQSTFLAADALPAPQAAAMFIETESDAYALPEAEAGEGTHAPIVLQSAHISLNTEQYDADISRIDQLVTTYGGWSEYWAVYGEPIAANPNAGRNATMTLRVPVESLQQLINMLTEIGQVTATEVAAEDISDTYYDTQGRLAMYQAQREQVEALMSEADSMADIIQIESRLSELQYTIETLIGRLNSWNSRADNAIVRLMVTEVAPGATRADETVWQRMQSGFAASLRAGGNFAKDMLVFVVMIAPYAICAFVIGGVSTIIWRRAKHRGKKRRIEE